LLQYPEGLPHESCFITREECQDRAPFKLWLTRSQGTYCTGRPCLPPPERPKSRSPSNVIGLSGFSPKSNTLVLRKDVPTSHTKVPTFQDSHAVARWQGRGAYLTSKLETTVDYDLCKCIRSIYGGKPIKKLSLAGRRMPMGWKASVVAMPHSRAVHSSWRVADKAQYQTNMIFLKR
jgi:hypothetical protein